MSDTITDYELEQLQSKLNQSIHDDITNYHMALKTTVNNKQSLDLVLSALASNLGAMIAYVPVQYREAYLATAKKIIDDSFCASLEDADKKIWGQVGHA